MSAGGKRKAGRGGLGGGSRGGGGRGEAAMVPQAEFESYYGRPIIKAPVWKTPDVPLYLFLGGMAGGSALLAEGAAMTGRPGLEKVARLAAAGGAMGGTVFLVHDLGRPERFLNMLRVLKPTSALSVGTYILSAFASASGGAAALEVTGWFPRLKRLLGMGAAVSGPPLATYTAALFANTAVPIWHEGHRELPFVFGGSGAAAAGGVGMLLAPSAEHAPAARMALVGGTVELVASEVMERRLATQFPLSLAEPYHEGKGGRFMTTAKRLTVAAHVLNLLGIRWPWLRRLAGATYVAGSVTTRFGIFEGGLASANDPKYTVVPQKARAARKAAERKQTSPTIG
ncbi:NrfD/PsrC family molybdoenzyme membrane anchor subunit [Nocardioides sp. DS6]|uniref:NrfD/PsrC family molybdoenzyme membrane anchor subunit n=1 Tax=Nocardioides eburneus TaxID=3231482 RepID=A0ABV3SY98_9ACTN